MSKKEPEAWDYASAEAYLKAGRNPDMRPLSDGWNTRLKRGTTQITLELHGKPLIQWANTGEVSVLLEPETTFVEAERINRYALHRRPYQLVVERDKKPYLNQRITELAGCRGLVEVYGNDKHPVGGGFYIDKAGLAIVSGGPLPPSAMSTASSTWKTQAYRTMLRTWVRKYGSYLNKALQKGLNTNDKCDLCLPISDQDDRILGLAVRDPHHLVAHMLEPAVPFALLDAAAGTTLATTLSRSMHGPTIKATPADSAQLVRAVKRYIRAAAH